MNAQPVVDSNYSEAVSDGTRILLVGHESSWSSMLDGIGGAGKPEGLRENEGYCYIPGTAYQPN